MSQCCVISAKSHLEFPCLEWIKNDQISKEGLKKLLGIGKVRTRVNQVVTDFIGVYNIRENYLNVIVDDQVVQLDGRCSLLSIDNKNQFEWKSVANKCIPKYALRVSFDPIVKNSIFIGLSKGYIGTANSNSPKKQMLFTKNGKKIDETLSYEVLCLNPSPQKLKHLCRLAIRSILNFDNLLIQSLIKHLKSELVIYLKYPSYLKCGQCLLRGDLICSKNNQYKLVLTHNGKLLFFIDNGKNYLFLYENVDSLQFHEFGLVVNYLHDFSSQTFINDFDAQSINFSESYLKIDDNGYLIINSPHYTTNFIIQFRDDISSFLNQNKPYFMHTLLASERELSESDDGDDDDDDSEEEDDEDSSSSEGDTNESDVNESTQ
jgi:hypothetical protein